MAAIHEDIEIIDEDIEVIDEDIEIIDEDKPLPFVDFYAIIMQGMGIYPPPQGTGAPPVGSSLRCTKKQTRKQHKYEEEFRILLPPFQREEMKRKMVVVVRDQEFVSRKPDLRPAYHPAAFTMSALMCPSYKDGEIYEIDISRFQKGPACKKLFPQSLDDYYF